MTLQWSGLYRQWVETDDVPPYVWDAKHLRWVPTEEVGATPTWDPTHRRWTFTPTSSVDPDLAAAWHLWQAANWSGSGTWEDEGTVGGLDLTPDPGAGSINKIDGAVVLVGPDVGTHNVGDAAMFNASDPWTPAQAAWTLVAAGRMTAGAYNARVDIFDTSNNYSDPNSGFYASLFPHSSLDGYYIYAEAYNDSQYPSFGTNNSGIASPSLDGEDFWIALSFDGSNVNALASGDWAETAEFEITFTSEHLPGTPVMMFRCWRGTEWRAYGAAVFGSALDASACIAAGEALLSQ